MVTRRNSEGYVVVNTGILAGQSFPLRTRRPDFVIGSDPRCDLCLMDAYIAPIHAVVSVDNAVYGIRPRTPDHELLVNSLPIVEPARLNSGDRIQIGPVELVFKQRNGASSRLDSSVRAPAVEPYVWKRRPPTAPEPPPTETPLAETPVVPRQPIPKNNNITGIVAAIVSMIVLVALVGYVVVDQVNRSSAPNQYDVYTPGTVHVLTFHAEWCRYCQQQGAIIRQIDRDYGSAVSVEYLDVDDPANWSRANQYGASSIPLTVILNDRGEVKSRWVGLTSDSSLRAAIEQVLAENVPQVPPGV